MSKYMKNPRCPDCHEFLNTILDNLQDGEVVKCPSCGLELSYNNGELGEILIDGEDWGE